MTPVYTFLIWKFVDFHIIYVETWLASKKLGQGGPPVVRASFNNKNAYIVSPESVCRLGWF